MASIRTSEQLHALMEERKRINQRKRELERKKYEKAREFIKQALNNKKKNEEPVKQSKPKLTFKVTTYTSPLYERYTFEGDLYQTREELMEAEDRNEGAIQWSNWNRLVNQTRKWIEENLKH